MAFVDTEFMIERDSIIPFNISSVEIDNILREEYKLIVYLDSLFLCSTCWQRTISYLEHWVEQQRLGLKPVYIFKSEDVSDIEFQLNLRGVTIPYFIDPTGSLKRINQNFPQSEALKTFLTKDNKVLIAGSPVGNPKMAELYLSLLKER